MVLSRILSTSFDTGAKGRVLSEMLWDFWEWQNCVVKLMVCHIVHGISEFRDANGRARHLMEFAELLLSVSGYSAVKLALNP